MSCTFVQVTCWLGVSGLIAYACLLVCVVVGVRLPVACGRLYACVMRHAFSELYVTYLSEGLSRTSEVPAG